MVRGPLDRSGKLFHLAKPEPCSIGATIKDFERLNFALVLLNPIPEIPDQRAGLLASICIEACLEEHVLGLLINHLFVRLPGCKDDVSKLWIEKGLERLSR